MHITPDFDTGEHRNLPQISTEGKAKQNTIILSMPVLPPKRLQNSSTKNSLVAKAKKSFEMKKSTSQDCETQTGPKELVFGSHGGGLKIANFPPQELKIVGRIPSLTSHKGVQAGFPASESSD